MATTSALAQLLAKRDSLSSALSGVKQDTTPAPKAVPAKTGAAAVPAASAPVKVPAAAPAAKVTDQAKSGGLYAPAKDVSQTSEFKKADALASPAVAAAPATSYKDASGKVDFAKLKTDMQSNLSKDELSGFQAQLVAAGNDAAKKNAAFDAITSAVNAKAAAKSAAARKEATAAPAANALSENVASATDPEKLSQNRIAEAKKLGADLVSAAEAKRDALVGIKTAEKGTILNRLGLTADLKPDLSNTDGLYYQMKKYFDDTLSSRNEQFSNAAANVAANLNSAGRQKLMSLGLSGKTDPGVIGMSMGQAGLDAMKVVNEAKNEYLNKVAELTKDKISGLNEILANGQITREAYDLAVASAKATARDEVNKANEAIMEKVFSAQETANAYDAENRTNRINTIMTTMTNAGVDKQTAMSLLDVFNKRRGQDGALLTPERALMMMAQWSKPEASIPEDYKPKTESEKAAYAEYQAALKKGATALKAAQALKDQLELLKATKASSSSEVKLAAQSLAQQLAPVANLMGIDVASLTRDQGLQLLQDVNKYVNAKEGDVVELLGKKITIPEGAPEKIFQNVSENISKASQLQ